MSRHIMREKFGSKIASTCFLSQSWAIYLIQKRQDIKEMTLCSLFLTLLVGVVSYLVDTPGKCREM